MTYENANDVVDELSKQLLSRYQIGLECWFWIGFLYEKCRNIGFKLEESCKDAPDWLHKSQESNKKIQKRKMADGDFYYLNCLEQKISLHLMKKYVK